MISRFNGVLLIVKNRGKPSFWCWKKESEVQNFMDFETRNAGRNSNFLHILEKKL